jgi:hypothetical protein
MKRILLLIVLALGLSTAHSQTLIALPTATSAAVDLTWTNGCSASISCSFLVYRCTGTVSACPTSGVVWSLITSTAIAPTSYTDTTVVGGSTYSYVVYAQAIESGVTLTAGPSNEVSAAVPLGPVAPTVAAPTAQ